MKNAVALVSAPWPLFNRPSIQLGTLKAYLNARFPDVTVSAHHLYLEVAAAVGYPRYRAISERTWLAESVYAALLFPERCETIAHLFAREAARVPALEGLDFGLLKEQVGEVTDAFILSLAWDDLLLAGFSACLCQLSATLYLIDRVKKRFPSLFVVFGGATFSGHATRQLQAAFPQIDAVVNGEGERPLSRLVDWKMTAGSLEALGRMPGVAAAAGDRQDPVGALQLKDLNSLPQPDYDDYFNLLASLPAEKRFFPVLPAEVSRGCRWTRSAPGGLPNGCAFCNLNRQWQGYRSKAPARAAAEIDGLSERHRVLAVALVDNLVPAQGADRLFGTLGRLPKDFKIFCEIRATTPRRTLKAMAAAGVDEVQIGIESLSTRLLKKLHKGTTAVTNLEIMKNCEELDITNRSNLILHFPGSDSRDVAETLRSLEFAAPFRPVRAVQFWLGLGSPVWENPRAYGIRSVFNHPHYRRLFPRAVGDAVDFMIQGYRGDLTVQRKLWQPVKRAVASWQKNYESLHSAPGAGPILSYRDGGRFILIRQRRSARDPVTHRLEGMSREIYLFCRHRRTIGRIRAKFPRIAEDRLLAFLRMMTTKRLLYEENGRYLSLAVRVGRDI